MGSGITTTIKIKPHLREFIVCGFLNGNVKVSSDDPLGKIIKPWLKKAPKDFIYKPSEDDINLFTFELPYYHDKNVMFNNYISPKGQQYIEDVFEIICQRNMFPYIDKLVESKVYGDSIKKCILAWCYSFNVTFEYLNYEQLKKAYYRYRIDKNNSENNWSKPVPGLSPDCPRPVPLNQ